MLDYLCKQTEKYVKCISKEERKKNGQFFTSMAAAQYMSELFQFNKEKKEVKILDPGAGTGILACALIEKLEKEKVVSSIYLVCYETDERVIKELEKNLSYMKATASVTVNYEIRAKNFITSQSHVFGHGPKETFDYIIGNPPYQKLRIDSREAMAMKEICFGSPNLYFLFTAMALELLKQEGEMVFIIPRSWTSGAYFKNFRSYLFKEGIVEHIHLFHKREKVFQEKILQETMIIKIVKTNKKKEFVQISSSGTCQDIHNSENLMIPLSLVVSGSNQYVYLITNNDELMIIKRIQSFHCRLKDIGLQAKTGLVVEGRAKEFLRNVEEPGTIPLFGPHHINKGMICYPIHRNNQYIRTSRPGLRQPNHNYLFFKRFTSKEEQRRLQCGIYLSHYHAQYSEISTHNKITLIQGKKEEISETLLHGLYVIFNSSLYDQYYRVLNGSTQVNATELNEIPVPNRDVLMEMGRQLINKGYSVECCDDILEYTLRTMEGGEGDS